MRFDAGLDIGIANEVIVLEQQVEVIIARPDQPERHLLVGQGTTQLGRADDNEIVLPDIGVSRRHARITNSHDGVLIEDMGSGNGTYFRGERVERRMLEDGDQIYVDPFMLTFRLTRRQPMTAPVAPNAGQGADRPAKAQLVTLTGNRLLATYPLWDGTITLGRSEGRDITLYDPSTSRLQTSVTFRDGAWWVIDEKSANGSWVNEARIDEHRLRHGDVLRLGSTEFRYEDIAPAPVAPAAPTAPAAPAAPAKQAPQVVISKPLAAPQPSAPVVPAPVVPAAPGVPLPEMPSNQPTRIGKPQPGPLDAVLSEPTAGQAVVNDAAARPKNTATDDPPTRSPRVTPQPTLVHSRPQAQQTPPEPAVVAPMVTPPMVTPPMVTPPTVSTPAAPTPTAPARTPRPGDGKHRSPTLILGILLGFSVISLCLAAAAFWYALRGPGHLSEAPIAAVAPVAPVKPEIAALLAEGDALLDQGKQMEALGRYHQALKLDPSSEQAQRQAYLACTLRVVDAMRAPLVVPQPAAPQPAAPPPTAPGHR